MGAPCCWLSQRAFELRNTMPEVKVEIIAATQAAENAMRKFGATVEGVFTWFAALLSIGALAHFGKKLIDAADSLNKMKQRVGESVESLSTLAGAFRLSNIE